MDIVPKWGPGLPFCGLSSRSELVIPDGNSKPSAGTGGFHCRLQALRLQPGVFFNLLQRHRPKCLAVMPCPRKIGESVSLKLQVRTLLHCSQFSADAERGPVYGGCFTARPRIHKKRIDLGDFLICSVRSAMTRRASAVTFTSAFGSLVP